MQLFSYKILIERNINAGYEKKSAAGRHIDYPPSLSVPDPSLSHLHYFAKWFALSTLKSTPSYNLDGIRVTC